MIARQQHSEPKHPDIWNTVHVPVSNEGEARKTPASLGSNSLIIPCGELPHPLQRELPATHLAYTEDEICSQILRPTHPKNTRAIAKQMHNVQSIRSSWHDLRTNNSGAITRHSTEAESRITTECISMAKK